MSQETHAGMWIGFRQPVRRVALERAGKPVRFTHEANPGEVWEENEFWVEVTGKMDPDGSLGIRQWVESPERPGELVVGKPYKSPKAPSKSATFLTISLNQASPHLTATWLLLKSGTNDHALQNVIRFVFL